MKAKIQLPVLTLSLLVFVPQDIRAQWAGFAAGIAQEIAPQSTLPLHIDPADRTIVVATPEAGFILPLRTRTAITTLVSRNQVTSVPLPRFKNTIGYGNLLINPLARRYANGFVMVHTNSRRLDQGEVGQIKHIYGSGIKVETIQTAPISHTKVVVGTSRSDVIRILGRPNVTIINAHGETMIFKGSTVIIQNGLVEVVH